MAFPGIDDIVDSVAERRPQLFAQLPDRLFAPLASTNRHQYWRLICALYDRRFGPDAPIPPSAGFAVREITRDLEDELLFIENWESELEQASDHPDPVIDNRAHAIYTRLRDCGWLRVERMGVREMVTMAPTVAQFLNKLVEFAQTGPLFVAGKVRSIEVNLKLVISGEGDGDSLQEAAAQARSLLEHIRNTGTNVRDLMSALGKEQATAEYVRRFFTDFVERVFIGDYRELRTRDHPLMRRQDILRTVEELHSDDHHRQRMTTWYRDKRARGNVRRAEELFERDIQRLLDLRRIDEYLDRLDDEIRRANRQALAYLDYRLRALRPVDHLVAAAIAAVKSDETVSHFSPFAPGALVSGEGLSDPKVRAERPPPTSLRVEVPSPEQELLAQLMLAARDVRSITPPKLAEFIRRQIALGGEKNSDELSINSVADVRALQTLSTLSMANASGSASLRATALLMQRGFNVRQDSEIEHANPWISHIAFTVERKARKLASGDNE